MENRLTIDLFAPGMGPLHRAGLGGLAATIAKLQSSFPQLRYDERMVFLEWDEAEGVKAFFQRFYEQAFGLKDGLIHLPGSYGQVEPRPEVKAALQQGMSLTILQFGPNRKAKGVVEKSYEIDDQPMVISHQYLTNYTHRTAWQDLFTGKGTLKKQVSISGTIAPGFVQRHVAFPSSTIEQPPRHAIALHFALVGTLSLPVDRKSGVLLVPEVENLLEFARLRGSLTPRSARACWVSNAADAALQAQIRLLQSTTEERLGLRRSHAMLFATKSWNEKQKSRAAVLSTEPEVLDLATNRRNLIRFEVAMLELPPMVPKLKAASDDLERPSAREPVQSLIRPLVADNLARGQPWFKNFRSLLVGDGDLNAEKRFRQLGFERKGLYAMVQSDWDESQYEKFVTAIHEAMNQRFGQIWDDANHDKTTFENRYKRQMERWRLRFINAKTADDFRDGLSELWGKGGQISTLQKSWREMLFLFSDRSGQADGRWQLHRDLVVLALVSYSSQKKDEEAPVVPSGAVDDDV